MHEPRARQNRRAGARRALGRARRALAGDAVPRDAPHRWRSTSRHPAVRVRRVGRRRAPGDPRRDADPHARSAEAAARAHTDERRSGVPGAAAARFDRVAAAGGARAVVLRLGARRPLVPPDRRDVRVARRALARRGRDGVATRRASAGGTSRTGEPTRRGEKAVASKPCCRGGPSDCAVCAAGRSAKRAGLRRGRFAPRRRQQ